MVFIRPGRVRRRYAITQRQKPMSSRERRNDRHAQRGREKSRMITVSASSRRGSVTS
jgi:hypothetical protein